jgi:hypothetical protein
MVSKAKPDSKAFFKLIKGFSSPKPYSIKTDIKRLVQIHRVPFGTSYDKG